MAAPTRRLRGLSFKAEYSTQPQQESLLQKMKAKVAARPRQPSMVHEMGKMLIPPQDSKFLGRVTVVLDLDETLVYAREGPLYGRPGLDSLMKLLADRFEAVAWSAGIKPYTQAILRTIDKSNAVQHCVYRHKKWFTGQAGYCKDLTMLGRDIASTLIIENTPDCIRGFENNGILVSDYEGGEGYDPTLECIVFVLQDMLERRECEGMSVPQYIASSKLLSKQPVPTDAGDLLQCYCLDVNNPTLFVEAKRRRVNLDLAPPRNIPRTL